ncbi:YraN family protein [Hippea jasoniae]|uniref:YraN family protein n=1 Tax=Hippea jasoniae TaxID=944479 RepID=UPI0018DBB0F3|nr:YraN family protein [Hippea jasoniae]
MKRSKSCSAEESEGQDYTIYAKEGVKLLRSERRDSNTIGRQAEGLAASFLQKNGYKILFRNYRCRYGEIDIVAENKDVVVIVEVKSRSTDGFGHPSSFVNKSKLSKIEKCVKELLMKEHLSDRDIRFDVIAINKDNIEWIKNIFLEE